MTTVQRMTDTLQILGFIGRDDNLKFYLEPKTLSLGYAYLKGNELHQIGESEAKNFSRNINHTVNIAVLEDLEIVFIYRSEVRRFLQFRLGEGSRLPSYCTSNGKVLLASLEDDDFMERVNRMNLEPYTRYTKTGVPGVLEDIYLTRKNGYGISDQELSLDVVSVGVPLIDHHGRVAAGLNISMVPDEAHSDYGRELIEKLKAEGRRISNLLDYHGPYPVWPENKNH